jgi:hypothetical protein
MSIKGKGILSAEAGPVKRSSRFEKLSVFRGKKAVERTLG